MLALSLFQAAGPALPADRSPLRRRSALCAEWCRATIAFDWRA